MIGAGLVAKKAIEKGIKIRPYIKTTLSPGSNVVTEYLNKSGLTKYLDEIGFTTAGYGCMTCIGNSGDLSPEVNEAILASDCVAAAVLSGNRNFEARIHPNIKANYLASPPLVVAYAIAGRVDIDFETEPIAKDKDGKDVYLRDIWPTRTEVSSVTQANVNAEMFKSVYDRISKGGDRWNSLKVEKSLQYTGKINQLIFTTHHFSKLPTNNYQRSTILKELTSCVASVTQSPLTTFHQPVILLKNHQLLDS